MVFTLAAASGVERVGDPVHARHVAPTTIGSFAREDLIVRTVARRLGFYVLTLWAAVTVNFFLPRLFQGTLWTPRSGGWTPLQVTPQAINALKVAFGLNTHSSTLVQYVEYLGNVVRGRLGVSLDLFPSRSPTRSRPRYRGRSRSSARRHSSAL